MDIGIRYYIGVDLPTNDNNVIIIVEIFVVTLAIKDVMGRVEVAADIRCIV